MMQKVLLDENKVDLILHRLSCQLIERHTDFSNTVLVGLQPRGVYLLDRLVTTLTRFYKVPSIASGKMDITFFRDDFRRNDKPLTANTSQMNVPIEGKSVVLIDDVLYTGRSIRAALTAIDTYGRPESIELLVLIDRRFSRHLPIQPDYLGAQIDAVEQEQVNVIWADEQNNSNVVFLEKKETQNNVKEASWNH